MQTTDNYELKVYEGTDKFNPITVENYNTEKIDETLKDIEETGHITPPFWPAGHPLPTLDALVLGRVGRKELSGPPQELSWLPASWRTWLFITRSPLGNIVHNSVAVTRRHAVLTQALGRQFIITREERSWGLLSRAAGQQGCV